MLIYQLVETANGASGHAAVIPVNGNDKDDVVVLYVLSGRHRKRINWEMDSEAGERLFGIRGLEGLKAFDELVCGKHLALATVS